VAAAGWRNVGAPLHADRLTDGVGALEVRAATDGGPVSVLVGDAWQVVGTAAAAGEHAVDLTAGGLRRRYGVRVGPHAVHVNGPEGQSTFVLRSEDDPDDRAGQAGECRAPLPGAVTKVLVAVGDRVAEGEGLVVVEAMKMEHTLRADGPGVVQAVHCTPSQQVDVGDLLVTVEAEPAGPEGEGEAR
jgi:biotin carboxyl carrier protein